MNFIQQAYKGDLGFWKYLIIPIAFFGLYALNFVAIFLLGLDQDSIMKQEIESNGKNLVLLQLLIPFVIFLGILFLWVKFIHKQSITSLTTSRKKIDWNRFFFAFFLWGGVTVVLTVLSYFMAPTEIVFQFQWNKFLGLLLIGVLLIPIQTSFEEYFFRGYLMQGIGAKFKSSIIPLVFTSVVFGLLHMANPEVVKLGYTIMIYYIGTGLFLGIITLMDEGLELALGFHAANNLIGALLVTANWTAFQTNSLFIDMSEPNLITNIFVPVFVFFPILLLIFSKKYKWVNWNKKLLGKIEKPVEIEKNQLS